MEQPKLHMIEMTGEQVQIFDDVLGRLLRGASCDELITTPEFRELALQLRSFMEQRAAS
jgi:hypothetical protein